MSISKLAPEPSGIAVADGLASKHAVRDANGITAPVRFIAAVWNQQHQSAAPSAWARTSLPSDQSTLRERDHGAPAVPSSI